jgi:hypothetical protein
LFARARRSNNCNDCYTSHVSDCGGCSSCGDAMATPCGGCSGCASGAIMQGSGPGIVVPESSGQPTAPEAPTPAGEAPKSTSSDT